MTTTNSLFARIAALHPSDRQWLLAQTSAETRARLMGVLETAQSGVPENGNGAAAVDRGALSARDIIASATPEQVMRALQAQPAWLTTTLLKMDKWPWSAALLKRMPLIQRATVGQPGPALKPALAAAILKSFARSLALIESSASAPTQRLPAFETLLQRLRGGSSVQERRP